MSTRLKMGSFSKEVWRLSYIWLLPLFFMLHGLQENYHFIPFGDAVRVFLTYTAVSLLLLLLFYAWYRSWRPAGMAVFALMALQVFFGALHDGLKSWFPDSFVTKYSFLLPAIFILLLFLLLYLRKERKGLLSFSHYLNMLLIIFILIDGARLAYDRVNDTSSQADLPAGMRRCDSCARPDVYIIIADEYTGAEGLKQAFGFDNGPFLDALRQRGFHVVEGARSNYNFTIHSVASLFGLDYLPAIEGTNSSRYDRNLTFSWINNNPFARFLRHHGYEVHNFSIFHFNDEPTPIHSAFLRSKARLLNAHTFLSRLDRDIRFNLVTRFRLRSQLEYVVNVERNNNEALYKKTWELAETASDKPRLVYTHLTMPHYPYYYDSRGRERRLEDLTEGNQTNQEFYVAYLQWANGQLLELVDHIRTRSSRPAVICLMSDHGFRHFTRATDPSYQFSVLNAVLLPDGKHAFIPRGLTNVNSLRVLLNNQFGQQLPLLKDSTFVIRD